MQNMTVNVDKIFNSAKGMPRQKSKTVLDNIQSPLSPNAGEIFLSEGGEGTMNKDLKYPMKQVIWCSGMILLLE